MTHKMNEFEDFITVMIPQQVSNIADKTIPSPAEIYGWKDYIDRRLYINYEITPTILDNIAYFIQLWNKDDEGVEAEDRIPIKIYINTDGGDLLETMHCCDVMTLSETPIHTICQAKALSAGILLLMSGHVRYAYIHSQGLVHSGSIGLGGSSDSVMDNMDSIRKHQDKIKQFILSKTKITEETYQAQYRKEWNLDSDEMLEYGIIDEIATRVL